MFSHKRFRTELAVRDYPMFPVNVSLFRVLVKRLAATADSEVTHGTYVVQQETFLATCPHHLNCFSRLPQEVE